MKAALILAGGKGLRLEEKKALITLKGKPLLQWVIDSVNPCVDEIILSGDESLAQFNYPVVRDHFFNVGPLAGFHAGFSVIQSEYTFVTGCDMPFINPELILYLFEKAEGFSCCLPREKDFIEPLCCVYNTEDVRSCLRIIGEGKKRIWDLIQCLPHPRYISFEEVRAVDFNLSSFRNINTLKDLHDAEGIV